jgi:small subunit ribosomal protein S7
MSRKKRIHKSLVKPDPIYNNLLIAKFVNILMLDGKKSIVLNAFYAAIERMKTSKSLQTIEALKDVQDPVKIFEYIVKMSQPSVEVRSRRIGGANYQIPMVIEGSSRSVSLSLRWLVLAIRSKKNADIAQKVYSVFEDNINNRGEAIKKKQQIESVAEANRAYAHFAIKRKTTSH